MVSRGQATAKWWLLVEDATLALGTSSLTAQTDPPQLAFQICRANVEPCQEQVSVPVDGTVAVDLVLANTDGSSGGDPLQVAAWETHLRLDHALVVNLVTDPASGRPVQERNDAALVLHGLSPLEDNISPANGQYFTVQNRYDPSSGQLDYAITLVRSASEGTVPNVLPLPDQEPIILGRVTLAGGSEGNSSISRQAPFTDPLQVVLLDESGSLSPTDAITESSPLATITVGEATTPELLGQVSSQGPPDEAPAKFLGLHRHPLEHRGGPSLERRQWPTGSYLPQYPC